MDASFTPDPSTAFVARYVLSNEQVARLTQRARCLASRLRSHVPIDDLIQAALQKVIEELDRWVPSKGSLLTFAEPRMRGAMSEALGTEWRHSTLELPIADEVSSVEAEYLARENETKLRLTVAELLDKLTPRDRSLLESHAMQGMTLVECGQLVGLNEDQARHRFNRVCKKLERELRRRGVKGVPR